MAAVLLGMIVPDRTVALTQPFGPVRMVPVTLLHMRELDYLIDGGAAARDALGVALLDAGVGHISDPARGALV
jgi:hypothetical protein